VLAYYLAVKDSDYEFLIYTLAALVVLLPLSFVTDRYFYSKREPQQKHGFAAVVMVLNAVSVFLVTLGATITIVVTMFNMLLDPGGTKTKVITLSSSVVVALLGVMLFVRIINPAKLQRFVRSFAVIVVAIAGVSVLLGIVGPFRQTFLARQDQLIEDNLSSLNSAIQNYASHNHKLPDSLDQVTSSNDDVQELIRSNLVSYRQTTGSTTDTGSTSRALSYITKKASYELCVTYRRAKNKDDLAYRSTTEAESSYISSYSHGSGRQCYQQTTSIY
jgi:type II secretory pathway pseudopilin PulG